MLKITPTPTHDCRRAIMSVHDAMYILGGKWKIHLIAALLFGPKRYSDLLRDIHGISGKVLSRELKEMEINQLVKRSASNPQSNAVFYELTEYGKSTKSIIVVLAEWGEAQREVIVNNKNIDK